MKKINIIILAILFTSLSALAQKERFEAIYIYNFTKKIEWPKEVGSGDFIIGILGDSKIIPELAKVAKVKKVGSRIIAIKKYSTVSEIGNCHILYIPTDESNNISKAKEKLNSTPTLIVANKKGMAKLGAAINFIELKGKLKFELNKSNAIKRGLKISADLEKLAIIVN